MMPRVVTTAGLVAFVLGAVWSSSPITHAQAACVSPPLGLVSWWDADAVSGQMAADLLGAHDGVLVGGTDIAPGYVGNAFRFDGVDDTVQFDFTAPPADGVTLDLWVKTTDMRSLPFFFSTGWWGIYLNRFSSVGGILPFFDGSTSSGTPEPGQDFGRGVNDGNWHHIAATNDGTTTRAYIDGILQGSKAEELGGIGTAVRGAIGGEVAGPRLMRALIDEFEIFNRALTAEEIRAIFAAGSAGKCKVLTVATRSLPGSALGKFSSHQLEARSGSLPYTWAVVSGSLPTGMALAADGVLSGTPTEAAAFRFTVRVTDSTGRTAEREFMQEVLATLPPRDLRITKWGSAAVPGRVLDYLIVVENVGAVAAKEVEVLELLHPAFSSLESVDPPGVADVQTLFDLSMVLWRLPTVAPAGYEILSYRARLDPSTPIGAEVVGGPACSSEKIVDLASSWASCLVSSIKVAHVQTPVCTTFCSVVGPLCALPDPWLNLDCVAAVAACGSCLAKNGYDLYGAVTQCMSAAEKNLQCVSSPAKVAAPLDPNEKGVTASTFIPPDQRLVYPVHFENVGNAEARDITLTDVLDADLDLARVQVFKPGAGFVSLPPDQTVILKEKQKTRRIVVDGHTIEQPVTENWAVSLNSLTRTLRWELKNIDLPPGQSGTVLFSAAPLPDRSSGTEIQNKATIQFEIFAPLTTNEVRNVIDTTPPACTLNPLPDTAPGSSFPLAWSGTDAVGEIATYTIFVSEDGGPFRQHRTTGDTSTTFVGQPGKRYGFLCIARDTAGNTEVQSPAAEVTTSTPTNRPPTASAGTDQSAECGSPAGATVALEGTASSDPDGDRLTYAWSALGITFDDPTSASPKATFPVGTTTVTLTVNDGIVDSVPDTVDITVKDTTAPEITAAWEPVDVEENEGEFKIIHSAVDVCDPGPYVRGVVKTPSLDGLDTEFTKEDLMKLEFDLPEKQVEIKGLDPEHLLAQLKEFLGFLVSAGQRAFVEIGAEEKQEFAVDADKILHIEAPTPVLHVVAKDASGNESAVDVKPAFSPEDAEGED